MKKRQVVINNCFGGFGLSAKAVLRYAELCGFKIYGYVDKRDETMRCTEICERFNLGDKEWVIYWVKNDLGDNPTNKELNDAEWFHERDIARDDVNLIKVIRELKKEANGHCADLKIVSIPFDVEFVIEEYDGNEHIAEKHRTWA